MNKPIKPDTNLEVLADHHRVYGCDVKWPCLKCCGLGIIYDPNDPPCPIDGNRGRAQIICPKCKGTKSTLKSEYVSYAKQIENDYCAKLKEYDRITELITAIRSKLTVEEIAILKDNIDQF